MITTRQYFKRNEKRLVGKGRPTTTAAISKRMGRVRQRDTAAEVRVRRVVAAMGWRYRTVNRDLPGSPDLANRARKWAVFVHGCFWHRHEGCPKATTPRANRAFWLAKFCANEERDKHALAQLRDMGFSVVTIWECQTHDESRIRDALGDLGSQ